MAIAGKVAPVPKGEWSAATSYEKLNIVSYLNCVYMAKQNSVGQEPILGVSDSYWMFLLDSSGTIATTGYAGNVKPDGTTISVAADGTISTSAEAIGLGNVDDTPDEDKVVKEAGEVTDYINSGSSLKLGVTGDGLLRVLWDE